MVIWWVVIATHAAALSTNLRGHVGRWLPPYRAVVTSREEAASISHGGMRLEVAENERDFTVCGELCAECFPSSSALQHSKVLRNPASLSNVFFDAAGEASVAMVLADDEVVGCAQLVPCVVRPEATDKPGERAFWVQYVCVREKARRKGAATTLMAWCECEAGRAAASSRATRGAEVWLAARQENAPALSLYKGLGFSADELPRRGHIVMRKRVPAVFAGVESTGPAARFDILGSSGGGPWATAADLVARSLVLVVAALIGTSCLVAPFFYESALNMFQSLFFGAGLAGVTQDLAAGLVTACVAEFIVSRQRPQKDDDNEVLDELGRDPSLAAQKLALWDITYGATADATLPIAVWQLFASAAEELYYRALILNGLHRGLALIIPDAAGAAVGLVASTALFAFAHADWAEDNDELKLNWLKETAPFGLVFGLLFLLQGDRLLAPLLAHAGLNTYWSAIDANKLKRVQDRQALADIFRRTRRELSSQGPGS